jgi:hypothetical protein
LILRSRHQLEQLALIVEQDHRLAFSLALTWLVAWARERDHFLKRRRILRWRGHDRRLGTGNGGVVPGVPSGEIHHDAEPCYPAGD